MSTVTIDIQASEHAAEAPVLLAVSYLRVSIREPAERGGTEEGFSIPAQREANHRKADELGARIVREFVDAGESARSADRDASQEMLAFIAEFYGRNLANEVTKGLTQELAQGGAPMRAPVVGYLNFRRSDEQGCEVRTVEVDPERAPLVQWVFETYAKGETSATALLRDPTARGLTTVPSPKWPSKP